MVKLDEVPDEAFVRDNKTDDGDWDTDSGNLTLTPSPAEARTTT